jgi:plastocyanin
MRALSLFILTFAISLSAAAATITVRVQDGRGRDINDAVVYAVPERALPLARKTAVMDQRNRMFIPHVLPVQVGTSVSFPNSDDVRHHVYSFSAARTFQLPLYKGTTAEPQLFDRAGIVTLGCNIHDQMSAFIVVVDTPFFAKTVKGVARLHDVDAGRYTVRVWFPDMREEPPSRAVNLTAGEQLNLTFVGGRTANANW